VQLARPVIAVDPRRFGRGQVRELEPPLAPLSIGADLRLFVTAFLAGFVFVSVLIG
jgi:hypothetical protein